MNNDLANPSSSNNQKLVQDLKAVVNDTEDILRATAGQAGDEIGALHANLTAKLAEAKARLMEMEQAMMQKARQAAVATDDYVHDNPWQSVIISGGIGFLIGFLISSRRD